MPHSLRITVSLRNLCHHNIKRKVHACGAAQARTSFLTAPVNNTGV
jgi:hypothetical protein